MEPRGGFDAESDAKRARAPTQGGARARVEEVFSDSDTDFGSSDDDDYGAGAGMDTARRTASYLGAEPAAAPAVAPASRAESETRALALAMRSTGALTDDMLTTVPVARALGLTEVLLTCNDTNAASIRVIESNGGSLRETKVLDPNKPRKRYYWITLS